MHMVNVPTDAMYMPHTKQCSTVRDCAARGITQFTHRNDYVQYQITVNTRLADDRNTK